MSLISEATIRQAAYEIGEPIYFWDLRACQAFWIDRAGNVIDSVKSHSWFAYEIAARIEEIEHERAAVYLMHELGWVRGRMQCDYHTDPSRPGPRPYIGLEIYKRPSMAQSTIMREMTAHFSQEVVLDAEQKYHFIEVREIERYLGC